jgi:RNA polymerase sigma factor FliA
MPQLSNARHIARNQPSNLTLVNTTKLELDFFLEQFPWVRSIAQQFHRHVPSCVSVEDLVNAGAIGLMAAMRSFDQGKHVPFRCYAKIRVLGEILDSLRAGDWATRDLRRKSRQLKVAQDQLSVKLSRSPTETELARKLGMTVRDFQILKRDLAGLEVRSLDSNPANDLRQESPGDRVAASEEDSPFNHYLRAEMHALIARAVADLPEMPRRVVTHYYFHHMTMKDVGKILGIGESRVSQIHALAIRSLRIRLQDIIESPSDEKPKKGYARTCSSRDEYSYRDLESGNHDQRI